MAKRADLDASDIDFSRIQSGHSPTLKHYYHFYIFTQGGFIFD
jgi:hypothetical protein